MAPVRLVVARDPADLVAGGTGARRGAGAETGARSEDRPASGTGPATPDAAAGEADSDAEEATEGGRLPMSEAVARWAGLLTEVPPEARLVIVLSDELSGPRGQLVRAAERLEPPGDVIRCLEATPRSAEAWVRRMVAEGGGTITTDAAQALVLRSGWDLAVLEQEVKKLLAYVGTEAPHITAREVRQVATPSAEASVFELVDLIGHRRSYRAVLKLRRLLEQGEAPLGLFAMVTRQVRLVLLTRELLGAGVGLREVEARLKLPTWVVQGYVTQARNFSRGQLVGMLRDLARLDLEVKTGRQEPAEALELFILRSGAA